MFGLKNQMEKVGGSQYGKIPGEEKPEELTCFHRCDAKVIFFGLENVVFLKKMFSR